MDGSKILLIALGTGALIGTIGGTTLSPTLKPPPDQPWRQGLGPQAIPGAEYAIVEAPPQDLSPQGWTYGAGSTFPEEAASRGARRSIGYRYEDVPPQSVELDEPWTYSAMSDDGPSPSPGHLTPTAMDAPDAELEAIEAAEAAHDAARDVADQGVQPAVLLTPGT